VGQLVVLKQVAHGLLTESPEVTAASMMDFLSDLGKGRKVEEVRRKLQQ